MSGDAGGRAVRRPRTLRRAHAGPGPVQELKDLLYEVYLAAGAPSLDEIAADVAADDALAGAPGRDTISRCISAPDLPPGQADAVSVAVVLARRAVWDEHDLAGQVRGLWVRARMAVPAGRQLGEFTDPTALEVHRAIQIGLPADAGSLPVLPAYVERDHDRRLRALVAEAAAGASRLAVLVGGSSTGKTRACWEAVQQLPDGWRLWHPFDPTRPEAAVAELERVAPYTVVWLNEAQHYLIASPALRERVASGLRTLFTEPDRAPVLILGTIWPEYWAELTAPPVPGDADPNHQARELLTGHDLPVPSAFTPADLRSLDRLARDDPRLAYAAARAEQGQITQYLAGAPALLDRYRTAPAGAKALIEAAMDARRLGHGVALPLTLLAAAAEGYLTETQWDLLTDDWLERALAHATAPLLGARGPLTRIRSRRDRPAPAQPHYRLADYLEQYARSTRNSVRGPAALWDAFDHHATTANRLALARAAHDRGLLRFAVRLYTAAADAGDTRALREAAALLKDAGRLEEAIGWLHGRVGTNGHAALRETARLLAEMGRVDEAVDLFERAAGTGDTGARWAAAGLLARAGRVEDAVGLYRRAVDTGDTSSLWGAARLLKRTGRAHEVLAWLQPRAEAGDRFALLEAARLAEEIGRTEQAIAWYRRAADTGSHLALWETVRLLRHTGRAAEALDLLHTRAESGDCFARGAIDRFPDDNLWTDWGSPVDRPRRTAAAERLSQGRPAGRTHATEPAEGDADPRTDTTGDRAISQDDTEPSEQSELSKKTIEDLRNAAAAGDDAALWAVARLLLRAGQQEQAMDWVRELGDAGHRTALRVFAWLLGQTGRAEEQKRLQRYGWEPQGPVAGTWWAAPPH